MSWDREYGFAMGNTGLSGLQAARVPEWAGSESMECSVPLNVLWNMPDQVTQKKSWKDALRYSIVENAGKIRGILL